MAKRVLSLKVRPYDEAGKFLTISVLRQSHRGHDFTEEGEDVFVASNGIVLSSNGHPEWRSTERRLFLRGGDRGDDNRTVRIAEKDFMDIAIAVK